MKLTLKIGIAEWVVRRREVRVLIVLVLVRAVKTGFIAQAPEYVRHDVYMEVILCFNITGTYKVAVPSSHDNAYACTLYEGHGESLVDDDRNVQTNTVVALPACTLRTSRTLAPQTSLKRTIQTNIPKTATTAKESSFPHEKHPFPRPDTVLQTPHVHYTTPHHTTPARDSAEDTPNKAA